VPPARYPASTERLVALREEVEAAPLDATPASDVASEPLGADGVMHLVDACDGDAEMRADLLAAGAAACSLKVAQRKVE
jgi:hypothetical protein